MICVLHGISIGLAIDLSTCADVRICAANARFAVKEVDIGLAADIGTLSRLPKCVGSYSWVKDVCLSARMFDAREALTVGFVSQVHETKSKAVEAGFKMAELLATKSPVAVQGTKELLNHARDHSVDESRFEAALSSSIMKIPIANLLLSQKKKACGIPPSGTRACSSPTMFLRRCCQACRRGSRHSRSFRRRLLHGNASEETCAPQPS